jgi:transcriptional regulator
MEERYKQRITRNLYEAIWAFVGIKENNEEKLAKVIYNAIEFPAIVSSELYDLIAKEKQEPDFEVHKIKKNGSDVDILRDATDYYGDQEDLAKDSFLDK